MSRFVDHPGCRGRRRVAVATTLPAILRWTSRMHVSFLCCIYTDVTCNVVWLSTSVIGESIKLQRNDAGRKRSLADVVSSEIDRFLRVMISPWKKEAGVVVVESIGGRVIYPKKNSALRTSAEREWQYAFSVRFFFVYVFVHGKLYQSGINARRKLQHGGHKRKYYMLPHKSGNSKLAELFEYRQSHPPWKLIASFLRILFAATHWQYMASEYDILRIILLNFVIHCKNE